MNVLCRLKLVGIYYLAMREALVFYYNERIRMEYGLNHKN